MLVASRWRSGEGGDLGFVSVQLCRVGGDQAGEGLDLVGERLYFCVGGGDLVNCFQGFVDCAPGGGGVCPRAVWWGGVAGWGTASCVLEGSSLAGELRLEQRVDGGKSDGFFPALPVPQSVSLVCRWGNVVVD